MSAGDLQQWISLASARQLLVDTSLSIEVASDILMNGLRSGTIIAKAATFFENKSRLPTERQVDLSPEFWDDAEVRSQELDLFFLPPFGAWRGRTSERGSLARHISVRKREIDALAAKRKAAGGRPDSINWEECLIEAARIVVVEGLPSTQAELLRKLLTWCNDTVGETQMKDHIAPFYRVMKEALQT